MCFSPMFLITAATLSLGHVLGIRLSAADAAVKANSPAVRRKGFSVVSVRSNVFMMFGRMCTDTHHSDVFWPIIKRVPVYVMGYFSFLQRASEFLFCDIPMFVCPAFSSDSNFNFPVFQRCAAGMQSACSQGNSVNPSFLCSLTPFFSSFVRPFMAYWFSQSCRILCPQRLPLSFNAFGRPLVSGDKRSRSSMSRHGFLLLG